MKDLLLGKAQTSQLMERGSMMRKEKTKRRQQSARSFSEVSLAIALDRFLLHAIGLSSAQVTSPLVELSRSTGNRVTQSRQIAVVHMKIHVKITQALLGKIKLIIILLLAGKI